MKPTIQYLPQWHDEEDQELYSKICQIFDEIVRRTEINISGLRNKYLDYASLNKDLVQLIIKEMGYDYITDVLKLTEEELQIILGYLGIIHAFKGTRPGFELCLQLMGANYELTEWWESAPTGTPDTFCLVIDLNLSTMKVDTLAKLRSFVRQYVYPILDKLVLLYHATLADLGIGIGGLREHIVYPGEQFSLWLMAKIAGASVYETSSTLYNSTSFWTSMQIGGASRYVARGTIRLFPT